MIEMILFRLLSAAIFLAILFPVVGLTLKFTRIRAAFIHKIAWGVTLFIPLFVLSIAVEIPILTPPAETVDAPLVMNPKIPAPENNVSPVDFHHETSNSAEQAAEQYLPINAASGDMKHVVFSATEASVLTAPKSESVSTSGPDCSLDCSLYLKSLAFLAWGVGLFVFLGHRILQHLRLRRLLAGFEKLDHDAQEIWTELLLNHNVSTQKIPIHLTDSIGPALVQSGRRTFLLMPRSVWEELPCSLKIGVLRHELAHYLYRDTILSPLVYFLAVLQWFNPLVWITLKKYNTASEWCCDEFAYGSSECGSAELAETFLLINSGTESLGLYLNTFAKFSTLDRLDRLTLNEILRKEHPMKKITVLAFLLLLFCSGVIKPQLIAKQKEESKPPQLAKDQLMTIDPDLPKPPTLEEASLSKAIKPDSQSPNLQEQLERNVSLAESSLERTKAENHTALQLEYAKAALAVLEAELKKNESVNNKIPNTVPELEMLRVKTERDIALRRVQIEEIALNVENPLFVQGAEVYLAQTKTQLAISTNVIPEKSLAALDVEEAIISLKMAEAETKKKKLELENAQAACNLIENKKQRLIQMNVSIPGTVPDISILQQEAELLQAKTILDKARYDAEILGPATLKLGNKILDVKQRILAAEQGKPFLKASTTDSDAGQTFLKDPEKGKKLDDLMIATDKDDRSSDEIIETIYGGLLTSRAHKLSVLRWFGNKYIWGQNPQNKDAIKLMIEASKLDDPEIYRNAVYFGLSVAEEKTPEILQAMIEVAMKTEDYHNVTGRINWGCRDTKVKLELLNLLKPYLESPDENVKAKAQSVQAFFQDEMAWRKKSTEEMLAKANAEFGPRLDEFKQRLLNGDSGERLNTFHEMEKGNVWWIIDDSFRDAFEACVKDKMVEVRRELARDVGGYMIWSKANQSAAAIELLTKMVKDVDREVRYLSVYHGLSTVRNRTEQQVKDLLEIALDDREWNMLHRITWGLGQDKDKVDKILTQWKSDTTNPDRAKKAEELQEIFRKPVR